MKRLNGASFRLALPAVLAVSFIVSGCATPEPKSKVGKSASREYFAESKYGVKASPRITAVASNLPRGGGRYQVGKPYQIRGKWYYPKEDPDYAKVGAASWYGDAFHGRLTANGEIYDMTNLTAAHPTMPLPSYARVTNLDNDSSLIVRVNDRGPFHGNRIIDLSKRAAELLDYTSSGIAKVKVEYVGPAPIEGRDDQFLVASYRPGGDGADPLSDGLPPGVMIAMNGPTPTQQMNVAANAFASQPAMATGATTEGGNLLPQVGPLVPDRPIAGPLQGTDIALLSYADQRVSTAAGMFDDVVKRPGIAEPSGPYINLGVWTTKADVARLEERLSDLGTIHVSKTGGEGDAAYSLALIPSDASDLDAMLRAAWQAGAPDAFAVRN
ncbi:septal ring lytic transglycosylase RlpA family protein [Nitratireductor luteus]|uniref:septal ring lytic transglycosylase RlpA family protein n=1 Tax=Nitratireductor luteus TaxID=2976980 RepID=UPI00223ECE2E|nr:septal ring lytic transglycosylase RlpA family protein [Nitratireductor luteus]